MRVAHTLTALLAAFAMGGASSDTRADAATQEAPSKRVTYADLDLSTPEDMKTLYQRIQSAARAVCKPQDRFFYFAGQRASAECYRLTVAQAVARLEQPLLTRLHDSETGTK